MVQRDVFDFDVTVYNVAGLKKEEEKITLVTKDIIAFFRTVKLNIREFLVFRSC